MLPLKLKEEPRPLQELHIGTIRSSVTLELITCAPNVGAEEQPWTEQDAGHCFFAKLIQCCFQVPQVQDRLAVPFLFFQPVEGMLIIFSF